MTSVSQIYFSPNTRVPYLTEPHIELIAATQPMTSNALSYVEPQFSGGGWCTDIKPPIEDELIMFAGQLCYQSFQHGSRTTHAKSAEYVHRIIEQRHFSVLEHVSVSYLIWGISRSLTHELVRHRHFSFSQVSQRYVNTPRFIERPEYALDSHLHNAFLQRIERTHKHYTDLITYLVGHPDYASITPATERRKAVQQVARSLLPNETEAPLVITGNLRSWRHFIQMRASIYAEPEIRRLATLIFNSLLSIYPSSFQDFTVQSDGTISSPNTEQ